MAATTTVPGSSAWRFLRTHWIALAAIWAALGLFGVALIGLPRMVRGVGVSWETIFLFRAAWVATGIALSPAIVYGAAAVRLDDRSMILRRLPLHFAVAAAVVVVHEFLLIAIWGGFARMPAEFVLPVALVRAQRVWRSYEGILGLSAYVAVAALYYTAAARSRRSLAAGDARDHDQ